MEGLFMKKKEACLALAAFFGDVTSHSVLAESIDHSANPVSPNFAGEDAIYELRGQMWPVIVGITTIDLALQSYFWGIYVPAHEEDEEEPDDNGE
jgi:hypothetical protein